VVWVEGRGRGKRPPLSEGPAHAAGPGLRMPPLRIPLPSLTRRSSPPPDRAGPTGPLTLSLPSPLLPSPAPVPAPARGLCCLRRPPPEWERRAAPTSVLGASVFTQGAIPSGAAQGNTPLFALSTWEGRARKLGTGRSGPSDLCRLLTIGGDEQSDGRSGRPRPHLPTS